MAHAITSQRMSTIPDDFSFPKQSFTDSLVPQPPPNLFVHQPARPHTLSSLVSEEHPDHPAVQDSDLTTEYQYYSPKSAPQSDGALSHPLLTASSHLTNQHDPSNTSKRRSSSTPLSQSVTHSGVIRTLSVPTRKSMMYSPVTYTVAVRCTHSDVMSISNTVFEVAPPPSFAGSLHKNSSTRARFPTAGPGGPPPLSAMTEGGTVTPLEMQSAVKARKKKNAELHAEHRLFMARLAKERTDRSVLEGGAATVIQRFARGFLKRPRSKYVQDLKANRAAQRLLMNSKARLTSDLLEMTERVGLPPIPGMTLNSRKMMERQRLEDERKLQQEMELASVQIQAVLRGKMEKKQVEQLRVKRKQELRLSSSIKIQKVARGRMGRKKFAKRLKEEQDKAITLLQARIRQRQALVDVDNKKRRVARMKRENEAATIMQSILRGKYSRRNHMAPSFDVVEYHRQKKETMYVKMDKKGIKNISLEPGHSRSGSPAQTNAHNPSDPAGKQILSLIREGSIVVS